MYIIKFLIKVETFLIKFVNNHFGDVAQSVERMLSMHEARRAKLLISSRIFFFLLKNKIN
jgi:hypothetical protein